jgi:NAD(P)-dependent dehydrogenase (short-subunit alcohol dehydrogenase family)
VCPGYTQSDLLDASVANVVARTGRTAEEALAALAAGNPQGRILSPREVADSVRWLCGADAGSVHGQAIAVCGGEVMQ